MKKPSIVYATKTRHSKKIAESIGKALNIQAVNVSARPLLGDVDLLFIVGGIYGGKSLPELLEFVKSVLGSDIPIRRISRKRWILPIGLSGKVRE